jgi:dTDP-4-dehydrorhamnose reductase
MKTVIITGGNGLLGSKLIRSAPPGFAVVSLDMQKELLMDEDIPYESCDITDREAFSDIVEKHRPFGLINAAAFTDGDGCETEKERAWAVNVHGAANAAHVCKTFGCSMIHLSTDYIFDGTGGPYREGDIPNPISYYGLTKWKSEEKVRGILPEVVIARTMVLYGAEPHIRLNFVTWLIDKLSRGEKVSIVTDQYGNPTLADDLAPVLWMLLAGDCRGVYHTAGRDWMSRFEFALQIAAVFDLEQSLITPTTSDQFIQPAPRPLRSGLLCERLSKELGVEMPTIKESLNLLKVQLTL